MNLTYDNHNELTYLTYDIFLPSIQKKFIVLNSRNTYNEMH